MVRSETPGRCVCIAPCAITACMGACPFCHPPRKASIGCLEGCPVDTEQPEPCPGLILIRPLVVVHDRPVQVAYDVDPFASRPLHLLYMRDDVAGAVLVYRFCHTVFGDQNGEVVAASELLQNRIQALGKYLPAQIVVLHAEGFVGFGYPPQNRPATTASNGSCRT